MHTSSHAQPGADDKLGHSVLFMQLQLMYANMTTALLGNFLTAGLLTWLIWYVNPPPLDSISSAAVRSVAAVLTSGGGDALSSAFEGSAAMRARSLGWLLVQGLVSLGCGIVWQHFWQRTGTRYGVEKTYRVLQAIALVVGFTWGIGCFLLYQLESSAITLGMASLLGGLSGGLLAAVGVRARFYWLVALPMGAGLIGVLLYYGSQISPVLPVALLLLLFCNGVFAHNAERHIGNAISLRFENLALVEQLREQTRVAEQANRAKSKFLASASHDLRQPAHALNLFLVSLSSTRLDSQQEMLVKHARAASLASREMLDTLLDFSRIEAGVMTPKPCAMPMAGLMRQLEDEFGPQADAKGLVYRSRDCLAHVHCDLALLSLILRNLIGNAIRYTSRGGVLVAVRTRGPDKVVQVWDTGVGIEPSLHEKIFQEFYQIENQTGGHPKGLGLGLAIVRQLVDSLGLHLTLASQPGKGTVFSLRIPGASDTREIAQACSATSPIFEPGALDGSLVPLHGLSVLVVDDEWLVREGMRLLLGQWGCSVNAFRDIEGATRYIKCFTGPGRPFDLLLTDYRLENGITGSEVIQVVRAALQGLPGFDDFDPPVIIVTGDTDPLRILQAHGVGATLLHKPIVTQVLYEELAKVRARLDQECRLRDRGTRHSSRVDPDRPEPA